MITLSVLQGSQQWHQARAAAFTASEAPAMLGASLYTTRSKLLREKHTGVAAEIDTATHMRFENGHRAEALARPLAEEFIGTELYPITGQIDVPGIGRPLLASLDGLTMDESIVFEHKALGPELRAAFAAGAEDDATLLPLHHRAQLEQQLLVSGAKRVLFMASEWTADEDLVEEHHCWYYPDAALRQQILDGWAQFEKELVAYALPDSAPAAPTGKTPQTLPALRIEVTGAVTASNLAEFKQTALAAIRGVNRDLRTDADFADAEKAVRWFGEVESRLKAAKEHALSQTADIDALFKALDDIGAEARAVRLDLDKLVSRRKTEVKEEAVARARRALESHIGALNAEIAPFRLPAIAADFAGTIKGLKSVASMQDKLDGLLATTKIAADAEARAIRANLSAFKAEAGDCEFLFTDLGQVIHKAADDFVSLVRSRIATYKADQEAKARAKAEAEAARQAAEATARAAAAPPAAIVPPSAVSQPAPIVPPVAAAVSAPRADEPATLKLGTICDRLGIVMTSAFVCNTLGIKPARVEGPARLYRQSDFARICAALQQHIARVSETVEA